MFILKIWAIVALLLILLNLIRFRRQLAAYLFKPLRRPLDWPVWVYVLRRWVRIEWRAIKNRRGEVGGLLFVLIVIGLLAFGLIATCPA